MKKDKLTKKRAAELDALLKFEGYEDFCKRMEAQKKMNESPERFEQRKKFSDGVVRSVIERLPT